MDTLGITEEERSEIFSVLAGAIQFNLVSLEREEAEKETLKKQAAFNLGIPVEALSALLPSYDEVLAALNRRRNKQSNAPGECV